MMKIIPNIAVENCKGALEFYKDVFGGELKNVQMADGKDMFKGQEGKVVHAELHVNADCILYFNDFLGPKKGGGNISILLQLESDDEISRIYSAIKEKGTVAYELQKTFWGSFHAVVADNFGVSWSLDYSGK
jgi:PhnB protein